ncbi:22651_t:CDS:2 [Racocetra persica]|uniref:22651_t:CDS:1 n=1 Tax=Racocetra persica TaxID=160502 RepID=A0ACA9N646_9GLOM|nr:22651_t:CDS:2 [Racocetra persica]
MVNDTNVVNVIDNNQLKKEKVQRKKLIFDNDQEFQEEIDLINEPKVLDVESETKINKIKINILQICNKIVKNIKIALFNTLNYYWEYPIYEAFLAILLDSRTKKIEFAINF